MRNWIPFFSVLIVCLLGFLKLIRHKMDSEKEREFSGQFLEKYREFCNKLMDNNYDGEIYQWLKLNSAKMQQQMGQYGIAYSYKPAFLNVMYNEYQMILNGISHIRDLYSQFNGLRIGSEAICSEMSGIDDMILTYMGALDNRIDNIVSQIRNPMIWLREGVRLIVTFPIYLMYWSGLIRYRTYSSLINNFFVKLVTFLVTLIGLISSIVTIVTGYTPFIDIINKFHN